MNKVTKQFLFIVRTYLGNCTYHIYIRFLYQTVTRNSEYAWEKYINFSSEIHRKDTYVLYDNEIFS